MLLKQLVIMCGSLMFNIRNILELHCKDALSAPFFLFYCLERTGTLFCSVSNTSYMMTHAMIGIRIRVHAILIKAEGVGMVLKRDRC